MIISDEPLHGKVKDAARESREGDISKPEWRTDKANAKRFVERHGGDVRWCEPWQKWLVWDGMRWAMDQERLVRQKASEIVEEIWEETLRSLRATKEQREVLAFAKYTASAKGINAFLDLAKDEPGVCILPEKLDRKPWLFNCINGTVDLKTGKSTPHNRGDYLTKLCPHPYITTSSVNCDLWQKSLSLIFGGNDD